MSASLQRRRGPYRHTRIALSAGLVLCLLLPTAVSAATIVGTAKNDLLKGTAKADKLYGKAGNDKLYGKGGNDLLVGGPGADRFFCGSGRDTVVADVGTRSGAIVRS